MSHAARPPRIFITGIGLWTGLGERREATWDGICKGRSALRWLPDIGGERFAGSPARCRRDDPLMEGVSDEPLRPILSDLAWQALMDARFAIPRIHPAGDDLDADRVATLIGLSKGSIHSLSRARILLGDPDADPDFAGYTWQSSWPNMGADWIANGHGFRGPCLAPVAACATGLVAVLQGADLIRRGACDVALAGSADASLEPILLAAFRKMRAFARIDGDPAAAVRPWDRGRSGFLIGEGGAVFVLEREDHMRARGVVPYAEVAGGALGSDAFHMTDLNPDPTNLAGLIGRALANAGVAPGEIDHVNVHGTATRSNDPLECRAIRMALGPDADRVACSANKAQIGHLLGAAGAAELAITCLAIRDGLVPPILNLTDPDPACDLDGTPLVGRSVPIGAAIKLSLGFGGHLAAAVLRRPEGPRRGPG